MGECASERTLSQYLDGDLSAAAAEKVRAHVAACNRCRKALAEMRALEDAIRSDTHPPAHPPDIASRVTDDLRRRGAFFKARVAAGKRRMVGDSLVSGRMVAALAVAAGILMLAAAGVDQATRRNWARKTGPVLADAERVLVRLVYVKASEESRRLAWAGEETRKLALPERLLEARSDAEPAWANDLAPLETTFTLLARGGPLPPQLVAQLSGGQLLGRATRLRETLARGG